MAEDKAVIKIESLPGMEGAMSPVDEAALRAEAARKVFEASEDAGPWMDDYWALISEGWPWRQAVYMIWMAQPKEQREPRTQGVLAMEILGLTTDRQIREWREKNPAIEARIAKLAASALAKHRAEIYAALIASASRSDPRAHSDRKLALEMLGDYVPNSDLNVRVGELAINSDEMAIARKQLEEWEQEQEELDGDGDPGSED